MSLFGKEKQADLEKLAHGEANENRINEKTRASIWLILALTVFLCAVVMCLGLIGRSAGSAEAETFEMHVEDIRYVANVNTGNGDTSPSDDQTTTEPEEFMQPVSVNDSVMLNILLIGLDHETEQTDTIMIVSINMETGTPSMLSIPRDTYISGNYDVPKINRVYDENGERGLDALKEAIENMVGFRLDNYLLFDEVALSEILELTGGIEFEVPDDPNYHMLIPGEQTLSGIEAFGIFRYQEDYTDVETEPYKVQRDFMAKIFDALLEDQDHLLENAEAICAATRTDLQAQELAYLGRLLNMPRFAAAFSRALPGGEISVDGEYFYQVDPEAACEILNEHFSPLDEALTEYDVNFRQKQGDSGEGDMPDWGFGGGNSTTEDTSNNTDESEPTGETDEVSTEEPTEETTETPTEEPTEAPSESETPEPLEPIEPGGDE